MRRATRSRRAVRDRAAIHALDHARDLVLSLGRLSRAPLASLLTLAVIGVALALPVVLLTILANLSQAVGGLEASASVSVFLRKDISDTALQELAATLRARPEVLDLRVMTEDQALAEFQAVTGFSEALALLEDNPLPATLVIAPTPQARDPESLKQLTEALGAYPEVEQVRLDMDWIERLRALIATAKRLALGIGLLLAAAVPLMVGNTLRLEVQLCRDEIAVAKLIGAQDAFVRRPFLYTAFWYGLGGGVLAWVLNLMFMALIHGPVARLVALYDSEWTPTSLGLSGGVGLLLVGVVLAVAGAWLAVGRQLRGIQPT